MSNPEQNLPPETLSRAIRSGNEYAWRLRDVPGVIDAAESAGLANLGGQPQFIYPDGTCELYWIDVSSHDRSIEESWADYVRRSAIEVKAEFMRVCEETDFVTEAHTFEFLVEKSEKGEDVISHLWFVLYFKSP